MYEKFGQFIDGKWQQSSSGETYEVINPATEEIIGKASKANSKDIQRALKSAEKGSRGFFNVMNSVLIKLQSLFDGLSIKIFEGFSKVIFVGSKTTSKLERLGIKSVIPLGPFSLRQLSKFSI